MTRRTFLAECASLCALTMAPAPAMAETTGELDFPLLDLHVHLDNSTIDKVLEIAGQRGVKFGIVEHAGTKENIYPVVLSNDDELRGYLAMLDGKPVYKGVQAEWTDWMGCFSPEMLGKLDYILTDAMTMPGPGGRRMKLWELGAVIGEAQDFMDRYVAWHVSIMEKEPLDIFANVSWLPGGLAPDYDALWTESRMRQVIDAAVKHNVALEISSGFKLPKIQFLQLAKAAGVKFVFGSNGRYPKMGELAYSIEMAKKLGLRKSDMFSPAPDGQKAAQRRLK